MNYEWSIFCRASQCEEARGTADTLELAKARCDEAALKDYGTKRLTLTVESDESTNSYWKRLLDEPWEFIQ